MVIQLQPCASQFRSPLCKSVGPAERNYLTMPIDSRKLRPSTRGLSPRVQARSRRASLLQRPRRASLKVSAAEGAERRGGESALYTSASVAGRCAVVTGASSGIGAAVARRLAEAGCRVVLVARRAPRLDALATELQAQYGTACHCVTLDICDVEQVLALPSCLPPSFRDVSVLVNNAGGALGRGTVTDHDMSDVGTMLDANVKGLIACTRAFTPGMVERGQGHVFNISSIAAVEHYSGGGAYCASKAAVNAFTASSRKDLLDTPVKITTISPGFVETEFSKVRFKGDEAAADAVYHGMKFGGPLVAADVADNIMYALTRPPHVHVCDMLVYPTCQASPTDVARD